MIPGRIKKCLIACEVVLFVARYAGGAPVSSKMICTHLGVTLRYLEQMLQQLVRQHILKSIRGPRGGYVLATDRRKITLSQIYDALISPATEMNGKTAFQAVSIAVEHLSTRLEQDVYKRLNSLTLEDLCKAEGRGSAVNPENFVI